MRTPPRSSAGGTGVSAPGGWRARPLQLPLLRGNRRELDVPGSVRRTRPGANGVGHCAATDDGPYKRFHDLPIPEEGFSDGCTSWQPPRSVFRPYRRTAPIATVAGTGAPRTPRPVWLARGRNDGPGTARTKPPHTPARRWRDTRAPVDVATRCTRAGNLSSTPSPARPGRSRPGGSGRGLPRSRWSQPAPVHPGRR